MHLRGMNASIILPPDHEWLAGEYPRDADLDEPRYLLGDAAAASDLNPNLLKSWLSREPRVIHFGPYDRPAIGKGSARVFTLRRIISIAMAAELVRLGVTASKAGMLAFTMTDTHFPNGSSDPQQATFAAVTGDALQVAYPDDDGWIFIPEGSNPSLREMLKRKGPPFSSAATSLVAVSYGAILQRVRAKLAERGR
jgi:hypothetical protein